VTSDARWWRDARVAIVTADGRGRGAAFLEGLAGAGWTVVDEDRLADQEGVDYPRSHPGDLEAVAPWWPEHDHGGPDAAVAAAA
jgi:NAD(P)-dependent dehydrogenase (short-subunit alcohol dehydrogenase family)